jgi:hypothetical protein
MYTNQNYVFNIASILIRKSILVTIKTESIDFSIENESIDLIVIVIDLLFLEYNRKIVIEWFIWRLHISVLLRNFGIICRNYHLYQRFNHLYYFSTRKINMLNNLKSLYIWFFISCGHFKMILFLSKFYNVGKKALNFFFEMARTLHELWNGTFDF